MQKNEPAKRLLQTQQRLQKALISLLLKRGWEGMDVRELCKEAGISRSTFYLHYRNKKELLDEGFQRLREVVIASQHARESHYFGFVEPLALHIFENKRQFLALVGSQGGAVVRAKFLTLLTGLLSGTASRQKPLDSATVQFLAGGFMSLATHCMKAKAADAMTFTQQFKDFTGALVNEEVLTDHTLQKTGNDKRCC